MGARHPGTYNEGALEIDIQDGIEVCVRHLQEVCCPHNACTPGQTLLNATAAPALR